MTNAYEIWYEYLKRRDHSEDLGVGGRMVLEWILRKEGGKFGPNASESR